MDLKKLLSLFLALVISVGVFVSCDKDDAKKPTETTTENGGGETTGDQTQDTTDGTVHVHAFGEWVVTTPATCTEEGVQEHVCECGEKETATVPKTAHTEVIDAAVSATCAKTGLTEGKHCSVCDTVLAAQTVVPKIPHTEVTDAAVSATCTKTGLTAGKHCSVCGTVTVKQTETPKKAHTYTDNYDATCNECGFERDADCRHTNTKTLTGIPATCTQSGLSEGKVCLDCEEILVQQETLDVIPHTEVVAPADPATCNKAGLTEGKHCSVCGHVTVAQQVDPIKPHEEEIIPGTPADYGKTGLTEGKKCKVCGETLVAQEIIDAIPIVVLNVTYRDDASNDVIARDTFEQHKGMEELFKPEREGYNFVGWYSSSGVRVREIAPKTEGDVTVYARWEAIKYTITCRGISPVGKTIKYEYTVEDSFEIDNPVWTGLKFDHWQDDSEKLTAFVDSTGEKRVKLEKGTIGDIEITAKWKSLQNLVVPTKGTTIAGSGYEADTNLYWFIYDLGKIEHVVINNISDREYHNGGTTTYSMTKSSTVQEEISKEIANSVSDIISESTGWSQTKDWSVGVHANVGYEVKTGAEAGIGTDAIGKVKASVEKTTSVEFGVEASFGGANTKSGSVTVDKEMSEQIVSVFTYTNSTTTEKTVTKDLTANDPVGYYTYVNEGTVYVYALVIFDPDTETYYVDTYSVLRDIGNSFLYEQSGNVNYAESDVLQYNIGTEELNKLINNAYYVNYSANNGQGTVPSGVCPLDVDYKLSDGTSLSRVGYTLMGWKAYDAKGNLIGTYTLGQSVRNIAKVGETVELKANWVANSYTVTFAPNGGSVSPTTKKVNFDGTYGTLPTPTRKGYTFKGWMYSNVTITSSTKVSIAGDHTLTAKWQANTYTVTFNANGGVGSDMKKTYTYDKSEALPANSFTRTNYTFLGWSTSKTATTPNTTSAKNLAASGNVTLYAVWVKTSASVDFLGREIKLGEGASHTDKINTSFDKRQLLENGYSTVTIKIVFDAKREDLISLNSAQYAIVTNDTALCGVNFALTILSQKWMEDITETQTIKVSDLNEDGSLSIRWSHLSGKGNGEHWFLGTTSVTVTVS